MRGRICLTGVALLLVTACGDGADEVALPPPAPVAMDVPAASAGGACRLLDFAVIEETTSVRFDIAASSQRGDTHTCVLRSERASYPELTLTVTNSSLDKAGFTADIVPDGARKASGLGVAAYRRTTAGGKQHGPVAEVGWLGKDGRLASVRFTYQRGAERATADAFAAKLVAFAKTVDTRTL